MFFRSNLKVQRKDRGPIEVRGLESTAAARLYSRLQEHEQAWREKNPIRAIEEMRAKAGGVTVGGHNADAAVGGAIAAPALQNSDEAMEKIKQLKEMIRVGRQSSS